MLESLIGSIYGQNLQLPLAYGGMYQTASNPLFQYYGNQAGNMTSIGNQSMGLYGTLAAQDMDAQRYNSLAPVLSGLLGQFSGFGGGGFNISPISSGMRGYQGVVDRAYRESRNYDDDMASAHRDMMSNLPKAPYMTQPGGTYGSPNPVAPQPVAQKEQPQQMFPGGGQGQDPYQPVNRGMSRMQRNANAARQQSVAKYGHASPGQQKHTVGYF